jgi:hypothetical protein
MNMRGPLTSGRVTFCGDGQGGSGCVASRVTAEGRIALSSSHDLSDTPAELEFDGHEIMQFAEAIVGGTAPGEILEAIDADMRRQPA